MNEFETQDHLTVVDATEATLVPSDGIAVDADGNPIFGETEVVGHVQSGEGEVAIAADLI